MLEPYGDKIIVEPVVTKQSEGGILLPQIKKERGIKQGIVKAVGPGKRDDAGVIRRPNLNEGDRVAYFADGVTEFIENRITYDVVEEPFIVGKIR